MLRPQKRKTQKEKPKNMGKNSMERKINKKGVKGNTTERKKFEKRE